MASSLAILRMFIVLAVAVLRNCAAAASTAKAPLLPQEVYWRTVLPETPMPAILQYLLHAGISNPYKLEGFSENLNHGRRGDSPTKPRNYKDLATGTNNGWGHDPDESMPMGDKKDLAVGSNNGWGDDESTPVGGRKVLTVRKASGSDHYKDLAVGSNNGWGDDDSTPMGDQHEDLATSKRSSGGGSKELGGYKDLAVGSNNGWGDDDSTPMGKGNSRGGGSKEKFGHYKALAVGWNSLGWNYDWGGDKSTPVLGDHRKSGGGSTSKKAGDYKDLAVGTNNGWGDDESTPKAKGARKDLALRSKDRGHKDHHHLAFSPNNGWGHDDESTPNLLAVSSKYIEYNDLAFRPNSDGSGVKHDANVHDYILYKNLRRGWTMPLHVLKTTARSGFLPRGQADALPFSLSDLPEILSRFSVNRGSLEAELLKAVLEVCERRADAGERMMCATSLEAMVDFAVATLGTSRVEAATSRAAGGAAPREEEHRSYTIVGVRRLRGDAVVCHPAAYPYAVFFCHRTGNTRAFRVAAAGEDGAAVDAVVMCHMNTTTTDPMHPSFEATGSQPGVAMCHFNPADNVAWVAAQDASLVRDA